VSRPCRSVPKGATHRARRFLAAFRPPLRFAGVGPLLLVGSFAFAEVDRQVVHDGNLVLEDIPIISQEIIVGLFRYQNIRSANFRSWTADSKSIYISTGFGDVDSIHRVDMPLGARRQLTFYDEPVGGIAGQPGADQLLFTRDTGGSEFAQIFAFDPASDETRMLSDGESRNGGVLWDRAGTRIAYQSTRRNGRSNDIWIMDPVEPENARLALQSDDGSLRTPTEFSPSGSKLLALNYVSVTNSRISVVDLDSGTAEPIAGSADDTSVNDPIAFDDDGNGVWLITDRGGEHTQLAWQSLRTDAPAEIITGDIPWSLSAAVISHDRARLAFVTNENGISNFVTFLENTQDYRRDLRRQEYGDERDPAMREYLQRVSPLNNVEKISVPMFIAQGENDPRVPVTEAIQMVEALRKEGHTVWYMNALNEGHGYRKRENRNRFQQATILFFEKHLVDD